MSIRFEGVSKAFGTRRVLNDVSFEVNPGEILFIIGKSGVGKSVTLKHLVGILLPDSGRIVLDGVVVNEQGVDELARVRSICSMVFQHPALFDSLDVYGNVSFGLRTPQHMVNHNGGRPLEESVIRERVISSLHRVHLDESILGQKPPELSFGMQKRVSIARALAPQPRYLLFDEPTTALDPVTTRAINELIQELSRGLNVTSIVVSHDMQCALEIADRILVLEEGRVLQIGTPEELKRSEAALIRDFLSETLDRQSAAQAMGQITGQAPTTPSTGGRS